MHFAAAERRIVHQSICTNWILEDCRAARCLLLWFSFHPGLGLLFLREKRRCLEAWRPVPLGSRLGGRLRLRPCRPRGECRISWPLLLLRGCCSPYGAGSEHWVEPWKSRAPRGVRSARTLRGPRRLDPALVRETCAGPLRHRSLLRKRSSRRATRSAA